jgi:hypothetical protein
MGPSPKKRTVLSRELSVFFSLRSRRHLSPGRKERRAAPGNHLLSPAIPLHSLHHNTCQNKSLQSARLLNTIWTRCTSFNSWQTIPYIIFRRKPTPPDAETATAYILCQSLNIKKSIKIDMLVRMHGKISRGRRPVQCSPCGI